MNQILKKYYKNLTVKSKSKTWKSILKLFLSINASSKHKILSSKIISSQQKSINKIKTKTIKTSTYLFNTLKKVYITQIKHLEKQFKNILLWIMVL